MQHMLVHIPQTLTLPTAFAQPGSRIRSAVGQQMHSSNPICPHLLLQ
jgi:hypothetical protein